MDGNSTQFYQVSEKVEILDEDEQQLKQPSSKNLKFELRFQDSLTSVSKEFLLGLMSKPTLVRNVVLIGHLHHGKTTFMGMLMEQTHHISSSDHDHNSKNHTRNTAIIDEQKRRISIKAVPVSLVLENSNSKSFLCNIMDTPGHVDFSDEMTAAFRLADGAVLIVDAAEGVVLNTVRAIHHAVQERIPMIVVLNKVDRLIAEKKWDPNEAYLKLRDIIKDINNHITNAPSTAVGNIQVVDPALGNVCFACASSGWSFTLQSFAKHYVKLHPIPIENVNKFASQLWGDIYFDHVTKGFKEKQLADGKKRSFVQFVLEPLYNLHNQVVNEDKKSMEAAILHELGVNLSNAGCQLKVSSAFGNATGFTDMLVEHIPSPKEAAPRKVQHIYTGPKDSPIYKAMETCDTSGPLMVNITKLYPKFDDCRVFDAFGRVYSGEIMTGQTVQVLGGEEEESSYMLNKEVTKLWVYVARHKVRINKAPSGSWVLIEGVDNSIMKTATLCNPKCGGGGDDDVLHIFRPLQFNTIPVVKILVEAATKESLNTSEVLEMKLALMNVTKSYPLAIVEFKEESGPHTISGTGELYLDCIKKDLLTELYSKLELKFTDPFVSFRETVSNYSSIRCFAETPNKKKKITMIAQPLKIQTYDFKDGTTLSIDWSRKKIYDFLNHKFYPDLDAQSIWAFGPNMQDPNILLDRTLRSEVDKTLLETIKDSIICGFQRGALVGPLCGDPIRNVNFVILDAKISFEPLDRGFLEIVSMVRHAVYSAFLTASPRLIEPLYRVQIHAPANCESVICDLLDPRRGVLISKNVPRAWPPNCIFEAHLPVIQSFGFEKNLHRHTQGQAHCFCVFDHWSIAPFVPWPSYELEDWPGYGMEEGTILRVCDDAPVSMADLRKTVPRSIFPPLQSSLVKHLAHKFMVETRRIKGLSPGLSIETCFDESMILLLAREDRNLYLQLMEMDKWD